MILIEAYEMAKIYWRHRRSASIFEVTALIDQLSTTSSATGYWSEVLTYLNIRKNGKKSVN